MIFLAVEPMTDENHIKIIVFDIHARRIKSERMGEKERESKHYYSCVVIEWVRCVHDHNEINDKLNTETE